MSDALPYPTLGHALAALDALPIAGSGALPAGQLGVDFDALGRARRLLPLVWGGQAVLVQIAANPQGGMAFVWRRPGERFELIIDPFALYACRSETASTTADWTRATLEQAVADARSALALPPLPERGAARATAAAA